ncbi:MAG: InlB B-repeat-containing protein, partial [Anaerolineaceae bacterium]|nr:InlB B-repeat-containing protein [Anaerolineaceae bacterium]
MNNKTVKLSVCLFMLFVLFLGMNSVMASVDPLPAESTTVSYTSDEEPYKDYYDVSFLINTGEMTKRMTFGIESGKTFGSALPELPDGGSWQWVADDGTEFTADTVILRDYQVSAVLPEGPAAPADDFLGGRSGVLTATTDGPGYVGMLKAGSNDSLTLCIRQKNDGCQPDIWYFEFVGNCVPTKKATQGAKENLGPGCEYHVTNQNGKYLSIQGSSWGAVSAETTVLVRNPETGSYYLEVSASSPLHLNVNQKGVSASIMANLKLSEWANIGSQFYFSDIQNLVTVQFNANGGNFPAPHSVSGVSGGTVKLPSYNGTKFEYQFLGWSKNPSSDGTDLIQNTDAYPLTEDETLYAIFNTESILWLHLNDGSDDAIVIKGGAGEVGLPEAERDGYLFVGWSADRNAEPNDPNLLKAGDRYPITKDFDFLYAVWAKKVDVYLVGGDVDLAPALTTLPWNGDFDLSSVQYDTENYTLAKWMYYDSEGVVHYAAVDETLTGLQDDITLYAIWKNRALVTLDANGGAFSGGGSTVKVHVNNGDTVGFGSYNVERSGFRLLGWALSSAVSDLNEVFTEYSITDAEAANSTTLYAIWGHQVSYNANGGSGTVPETQTVIAGSGINLPSFSGTKKSGNVYLPFCGWYTKAKYDNAHDLYDPNASYTPDADVTFYAQYTVTITLNPADGQSVSPEDTILSLDGAQVDLGQYTAVYQYGTLAHKFLGWGDKYTSPKPLSNSYTSGNTNRTLYALWDQDAILCYDANNGTDALKCERHARYETVGLIDPSYLTVPEGAKFTGWSYFSESTTPDAGLSADAETIILPGRDVTLYAVWQDNRVTLTFDDNGGSIPVQNIIAEYGTTFTMPNYHGTKEGYTFRGWAESNKNVSPAYTVGQEVPVPNKDKTYYAVWSKPYTITYVVQNGKTPAPQTLMAGSSIALPGEAEVGTRTGYVLKGWSLQRNGAVHYLPGGSFVVPVTDITLYAIWQQEQVKITFDGNGNTAGTVPAAITESYTGEFTAPDFEGAEKNGKVFVGWDTSNKAANAAYKVGNTYPMPASNTRLYAVWKDNVTISFDPNTGTGVMDDLKIQGAPGTTVTLDAEYDLGTNGSLTFVRWLDGDVSYTEGSVYKIPTEDRTLYAEWSGTVKLCFDVNGGSDDAPECKDWDGVHDVSVPDYKGTKTGARFIGWATQKDIKS